MKKENVSYFRGVVLVLLSALMFGVTPVIGKLSYENGCNPVMLAFLRSFLAIPFLAVIMKMRNLSFAINRKEAVSAAVAGVFGTALTVLTLYLSYIFIPVGTATTLHFLYPAFVMAASIIFFRERMTGYKAVSLLLSLCGVVTFAGKGGACTGIILALVSAVSYAFYTVYLDRSILKQMDSLKVNFYTSLFMSAAMFAAGAVSGQFTLGLTPAGWLCSLAVSILASVIGVTCFQAGVRRIGAVSTGMYSLLEPVSSLAAGALFLGERVPPAGILGCCFILASLIIYSRRCTGAANGGKEQNKKRISVKSAFQRP